MQGSSGGSGGLSTSPFAKLTKFACALLMKVLKETLF